MSSIAVETKTNTDLNEIVTAEKEIYYDYLKKSEEIRAF